MAPKKKGNKRQDDDWEAELGESIPPVSEQPQEETPADGAPEDDGMSGGLLAALRKNKTKKAKKGKPVNDFVEGEDATEVANGDADFSSKQPEEGTFDEEDVFAGGKKAQKPAKATPPPPAEPEGEGEFRVKSKKEKEREKKEREKQRKREQVCLVSGALLSPARRVRTVLIYDICIGCKEEDGAQGRACQG
jgi:translation initiation factor 5B